jgi:hypothetical protein
MRWLLVLLALVVQVDSRPPYVREGDRVEARLRGHRESLAEFRESLRAAIAKNLRREEAEPLLGQMSEAPPQTGVYGYQILPRIAEAPAEAATPSSFTYSWAVTEGYIDGETQKLDRARAGLGRAAAGQSQPPFSELVREYRSLLRNQRTVDQYVQYNRFWQRAIAEDRRRFDELTELYHRLKSGSSDTAGAIRQVLGTPRVPRFLQVRRNGAQQVVLRVPVYTDLEDDGFLDQAKAVIEDYWRVEEDGIRYILEVEYRKRPASQLYGRNAPRRGDNLDVTAHVGRFPSDGAVLTSGAEFTYAGVGRYIALGPGDLSPRIFAHEFGHLLGFADGYIRGYRDLGEQGFEILELTAFFDDIMSAPRQGRVQATHFRLLLEARGSR